MTMIAVTSDLHGILPHVEKIVTSEINALLIGGDICPSTCHFPHFQMNWLKDQFGPWIDTYFPHVPVVMIAGNHDFVFQEYSPKDIMDLLPDNIRYLQDDSVTITSKAVQGVSHNIRIYGTPWTPIYGNWAFMKSEKELQRIFEGIPSSGIDILLSHGPPHGVWDKNIFGESCGSTSLRNKLLYLSDSASASHAKTVPSMMFFGHIHESWSALADSNFYYTTEIKAYNVSALNENYMIRKDWLLFYDIKKYI